MSSLSSLIAAEEAAAATPTCLRQASNQGVSPRSFVEVQLAWLRITNITYKIQAVFNFSTKRHIDLNRA